jgi:two-component SAPR family response regulator
MSGQALRILIVEDHFLIAKQLAVILTVQAGHEVVGIAGRHAEACRLITETLPDLVFLDISLADGDSGLDTARFVAELDYAHVVFTTANRRRVPDDFCGSVGVLEKPFTTAGVLSAMNFLAARLMGTRDFPMSPSSLALSPAYRQKWTVDCEVES